MTKSILKFSNTSNKIIINGFINNNPYKKVFNTTFKKIKEFNRYSVKNNLIECKRYSEHHPLYGYYYENFRKTKNGYKRTLKHFSKNVGYKHKTVYIDGIEYLYKVLYKKNIKLQFIKQIEYVYENNTLIKIKKYNNGNLIKEYII